MRRAHALPVIRSIARTGTVPAHLSLEFWSSPGSCLIGQDHPAYVT